METKEPTNKPLKKGKTLLLFDIDGTLTAARQNMKQNMYDCLKKASTYEDIDLATVGGSDLPKAKEQLQSAIDLLKFVFTENGLVYLDEKKELHKVDKVTNFLGFEKYKEFVNFCMKYIAELDIPVKTGTFIELRTGLVNVSPIGRNCTQEERDAFVVYNKEHKIIKWFWEIVYTLDQKQLSNLLMFSTGTSRVPFGGFAALESNRGNLSKFKLERSEYNFMKKNFIKAHTCFNRLEVPEFDSKEEMEEAIKFISSNEIIGFGIE